MTPEQFKALGLKEGDKVSYTTVNWTVSGGNPNAADGRPLRLVSEGGVVTWPLLANIRSLEVIERVEAPLAVGDRIWHKNGAFGESKTIVALVDVGDVPHVVFPGFCNADGLVCGPVADYVRAKA